MDNVEYNMNEWMMTHNIGNNVLVGNSNLNCIC